VYGVWLREDKKVAPQRTRRGTKGKRMQDARCMLQDEIRKRFSSREQLWIADFGLRIEERKLHHEGREGARRGKGYRMQDACCKMK
jgi:hypothetical protein